jgi:hypothetical protein
MPAARLDCLDVMQAHTDVPDDGFSILHGSIPTLGGTSTASSSCPGGAAASCGTISATNNSTTTGCASQTPADTTSGVQGVMEQRLAREQFSTREH